MTEQTVPALPDAAPRVGTNPALIANLACWLFTNCVVRGAVEGHAGVYLDATRETDWASRAITDDERGELAILVGESEADAYTAYTFTKCSLVSDSDLYLPTQQRCYDQLVVYCATPPKTSAERSAPEPMVPLWVAQMSPVFDGIQAREGALLEGEELANSRQQYARQLTGAADGVAAEQFVLAKTLLVEGRTGMMLRAPDGIQLRVYNGAVFAVPADFVLPEREAIDEKQAAIVTASTNGDFTPVAKLPLGTCALLESVGEAAGRATPIDVAVLLLGEGEHEFSFEEMWLPAHYSGGLIPPIRSATADEVRAEQQAQA